MNGNGSKKRVKAGSGTISLGEPLGEGTEGTVYSIKQSDEAVAKILNEEKRKQKKRKLKSMLRDPPDDPTHEKKGVHSIVWPTELLNDPSDGEVLGYMMPYLDLDQYMNAHAYARGNLEWTDSSWKDRYETAFNLTLSVGMVHQYGHAIGDMNHMNILVKDGFVSLIDCDSFHISGKNTNYEGDTVLPRYSPPRGRGKKLKLVRYADRFGLAIHIFQFLMEGAHPFTAVGSNATHGDYASKIKQNRFPQKNPDPGVLEPPDRVPDYSNIPEEIRELFERCFVYGKRRPQHRPTAQEWAVVLANESDLADGLLEGKKKEEWTKQREERKKSSEKKLYKKWEKYRNNREKTDDNPEKRWEKFREERKDSGGKSSHGSSEERTDGGQMAHSTSESNWIEEVRGRDYTADSDQDSGIYNTQTDSISKTAVILVLLFILLLILVLFII